MDPTDPQAARDGLARRLIDRSVKQARAHELAQLAALEATDDAGLDRAADDIADRLNSVDLVDGSPAQQKRYLRDLRTTLTAERDAESQRQADAMKRLDDADGTPAWARRVSGQR